MRKVIVALTLAGALAAIPFASSASAGTCVNATGAPWCGYGTSHTDNAADPEYWTADFAANGPGNSAYCADPNLANDDNCPGGTLVTFAGFLSPAGNCVLGCNHGPPPGGWSAYTLGAVYVGTNNTNGVGASA